MSRRLGCLAILLVSLSPALRAEDPGAVTVPMHLDQGVIFFDATLDGKGPFAFILDPGAGGVITGDALHKLGVSGSETAQVDVAIGAVHVGRLSLPVMDGDGTDLYPRHDPAGPPIAG